MSEFPLSPSLSGISLMAFLLPCFFSALAALLAWQMGGHCVQGDWRRVSLALSAVTALLIGQWGLSAWQTESSSMIRALDCLAAAAFGWAFVGNAGGAFVLGVLSMCAALGLLASSGWQATGVAPIWITPMWWLGTAVIHSRTLIWLWFERRQWPWLLWVSGAALALAAFLGVAGLGAAVPALRLLAFACLTGSLAQRAVRELAEARGQLAERSASSSSQSRRWLALLRGSATLARHWKADSVWSDMAQAVAEGLEADSVLVAAMDDGPEHPLRIQAVYPGSLPRDMTVSLAAQPALAAALEQRRQMAWSQPQRGAGALALLLQSNVGPAIVQPLLGAHRIIGVIAALNGRSQRAFAETEQQALEALSVQMAMVSEQALVSQQLDAQTRDLVELLARHQDESDRRAAILDSIADGVVVSDPQDQVVLANAAAAKILDMPCQDLLGQPFGAIFGQVVLTPDGASRPGDARAVFEIGGRSIQSNLAPVLGQDGQMMGMVAVLRDVSAERAAERAKSDFIATISHELRTPLTPVLGYADILIAGAGGGLNEAQRGFVNSIHSSAERLAKLVNTIIRYAEIEQGSMQIHRRPTDVLAVLQAAVNAMRPKIEERGQRLIVDIRDDLAPVLADPACVQQILEQLLDNAMRFTPDNGQITLRAGLAQETDSRRPTQVEMVVIDTGVGLTLPDQQRIFERFYRADNPLQVSAGGMGIGLTIARALAQGQGGELGASSPGATEYQAGHGSVFTLTLPVAQPEPSAVEPLSDDWTAGLEDVWPALLECEGAVREQVG